MTASDPGPIHLTYLGGPDIGARGSAYWNVRLLDRLFDFDDVRVHSRRPESRRAFGERLAKARTLGVGQRLRYA